MFGHLISNLIPKRCIHCGKSGYVLCPTCEKHMHPALPECVVCRKVSKNFETHISCQKKFYGLKNLFIAYEYDDVARSIMKDFKLRLSFSTATLLFRLLTKSYAYQYIARNFQKLVIIPVPRNDLHIKERGFNHLSYLYNHLSYSLDSQVVDDFVYMKSNVVHQANLNRKARLKSVKHFYIKNRYTFTAKSNVLLFDDVVTTGSTMKSLAKVIKSYCPLVNIFGLALFRPKYRQRKV